MKTILSLCIIGAGGVASYMLPALRRSFTLRGLMFDGDKLERKNLDRQLFSEDQLGDNKAVALIAQNELGGSIEPIPEYFDMLQLEAKQTLFRDAQIDLFVCIADNHPARAEALDAADLIGAPVVVAANEYSTSQAFIYFPEWRGTKKDPRIRYPELLTDKSGSPMGCQGMEAMESSPQLAIANQVSAAFANYLIYLWFMKFLEVQEFMPVEFQSTFSKAETLTMKDLA